MAPPIPDRWLNYKPIGERIEGTRFIAFKVPLREHVNESVEESNRLDGEKLLKNVPNLGLIIDLTNTNRYYEPAFFKRIGVEHVKIMIPGHVTPPNDLVKKFKLYVMSFLNSNKDNDKLIGVHCTHGVNRTGYLICHYMISEMTMKPQEAIKRFDTARGHKLERQNYLQALNDLSTDGQPPTKKSKPDTQSDHQSSDRIETYKEHRQRKENTRNVDRNRELNRNHASRRDHHDRVRHRSNYHSHSYSQQPYKNESRTASKNNYNDNSNDRNYSRPVPSNRYKYVRGSEDRYEPKNIDFGRSTWTNPHIVGYKEHNVHPSRKRQHQDDRNEGDWSRHHRN